MKINYLKQTLLNKLKKNKYLMENTDYIYLFNLIHHEFIIKEIHNIYIYEELEYNENKKELLIRKYIKNNLSSNSLSYFFESNRLKNNDFYFKHDYLPYIEKNKKFLIKHIYCSKNDDCYKELIKNYKSFFVYCYEHISRMIINSINKKINHNNIDKSFENCYNILSLFELQFNIPKWKIINNIGKYFYELVEKEEIFIFNKNRNKFIIDILNCFDKNLELSNYRIINNCNNKEFYLNNNDINIIYKYYIENKHFLPLYPNKLSCNGLLNTFKIIEKIDFFFIKKN